MDAGALKVGKVETTLRSRVPPSAISSESKGGRLGSGAAPVRWGTDGAGGADAATGGRGRRQAARTAAGSGLNHPLWFSPPPRFPAGVVDDPVKPLLLGAEAQDVEPGARDAGVVGERDHADAARGGQRCYGAGRAAEERPDQELGAGVERRARRRLRLLRLSPVSRGRSSRSVRPTSNRASWAASSRSAPKARRRARSAAAAGRPGRPADRCRAGAAGTGAGAAPVAAPAAVWFPAARRSRRRAAGRSGRTEQETKRTRHLTGSGIQGDLEPARNIASAQER